MKKGFLTYMLLFVFLSAFAQGQKKDTIVNTEVVNVVTKYNPEIADAKKIKSNPTIKLLKKNNKKKLKYTIFSAPVASTFTPKTGVLKSINFDVKERIYNNYFAGGYGNYKSPYAELFIYHRTRFDNEFGLHATYVASAENVRNSLLNSDFSNFNATSFFKQEASSFDWKVTLNTELNKYNWYGLPSNKMFNQLVINSIDEVQNYNYLKLAGKFKFHDSYIKYGNIAVSYFTDNYNSAEVLVDFDSQLYYPLDFLSKNLNEIAIKAGIEFLKGNFKNNYNDTTRKINYNQITFRVNPTYKLEYLGLNLNAGLKTYVSLDPENSSNNIFIFPNIFIQTPILKKYINTYAGFTGNLHTNTYKSFTEENPYVSPTLFITQTAETSNFYAGLKGNITRDITYNLKVSFIKEEDKPLFLRNSSKSDGTTSIIHGENLKGYEYGNSFRVFYDDVKTTTIFSEIEYLFNKNLTFSTQVEFNNYTTTTAVENWNLPSLQSTFLAKYKTNYWYATANIFYVSERKDVLYNAINSTSLEGIETINSFVDINLNGGYHFNDKFSIFLNINNVLNTKYQRFANFDTQGFQILGGITYKFDF